MSTTTKPTPARPSPANGIARRILLAILAALLLAAYTWLLHDVFTSKVPSANDFFSPWSGAYLYFTRGLDPYSDEVGVLIQDAIFGVPATPGETLGQFVYPFYVVFLVGPYVLLPTYAWAQAAWQTTLLAVTVAALFLTLSYHRWQPRPWLLGILVVWTLAFYPTARALLLGQLALPVFGLTVLALWLINPGHHRAPPTPTPQRDLWAGALLALTTVKPQMQFLILPFVMLWALRQRRWLIIASFAAMMAVLLGASFILLPTWLVEWLGRARVYPNYTPPAVLYILTREVLPLGGAAGPVERVLDASLGLYLLYEWWRVLWRREDDRLDWVIGLTLVSTHLIALRTATTQFVVFVFPLVALLRDLERRKPWGLWAALGLMLALVVGTWWLFLATVQGSQEHNLVHVPLPLVTLALVLVAPLLDTTGGQAPQPHSP